MWGRAKPPPARTGSGFTGFLVKNVIVLVVSFIIAFYFAPQVLLYLGFLLKPVAGLLGMLIPEANDPFWVSYILIYAMISLLVMFFRYKTGSRI